MSNETGADQASEPGQEAANTLTANGYVISGNEHLEKYIDASTPNVARIYDYLLGGKNNYSADRDAATELLGLVPDVIMACYHNRKFLQRAVRFLAEAGIGQFIDIGTGLPTQGNVHEIAQSIDANARVLYVDYDPVVTAHAQALVADNRTVVAINRDLRHPDQILRHPALQALIDLDKPVAILLVAVLHFIGLFEVNRDGVSDWLPGVFSWRLRCVMGVLCPGCRQCGRACADLPGYGIRMPGGLRAWRAGSGSRRSRS